MIETEDYKLPHKQSEPQPRQTGTVALDYLERLPWRPFDMEW